MSVEELIKHIKSGMTTEEDVIRLELILTKVFLEGRDRGWENGREDMLQSIKVEKRRFRVIYASILVLGFLAALLYYMLF